MLHGNVFEVVTARLPFVDDARVQPAIAAIAFDTSNLAGADLAHIAPDIVGRDVKRGTCGVASHAQFARSRSDSHRFARSTSLTSKLSTTTRTRSGPSGVGSASVTGPSAPASARACAIALIKGRMRVFKTASGDISISSSNW